MSEHEDDEQAPIVRNKVLRCRRTGQIFNVAQHEVCLYCSGDAKTIENAHKYEDFCEFRPGVDPINFGFPLDSSRVQHG